MDLNETAAGAAARRNEALTSVAGSLAHCADLEAVLAVGLDATLRATHSEMGGIYLLDEEGRALRLTRHHRGAPPEYVEAVARFARGEAVLGRALEGDVPVVVRDLSAMPEAREASRRLGLRSCVLLPLVARGRALGILATADRALRDFAPEDLAVLEAIGGMLGGAIETSRLLARTERHLAQAQALWEIDRAILDDRELSEVLTTIAREAGRLGGGDSAIVLLNGDPEPKVAGFHGPGALEALGVSAGLKAGPLLPLLLDRTPATIGLETATGAGRAFVVPLRAGDEALGALVVVKPDEETASEDLAILETFGHQAAAALAKARARDAAGRRANQLYLVSAAAEIATSTLDVSVLLGSIARYVQRSLEYPSVGVYLVDATAREAVLEGASGGAGMPKTQRFGDGVVGWAAERGERALVRDVRREPRFQSVSPRIFLSALAVPVRLAGEVVAVIAAESGQVDAFDASDVIALDAIAAQVASGIRNARLFEEKVRALRSLEILQEITNVLNSDLDLDALLLRIARRSVDAVKPAQMGSVLLYDGDALTVRSSFGYPRPEALARVRLAFHEGLPGAVFVSGHGRFVGSSASDWGSAADAFRDATGEERSEGALCVPISLPEQKLGVLLLESFASGEAFSDEDLRFAATLADQAAIAIGNALHLRKILELDRQRQNYLSNVSHELRTPLTVIQGYVEALRSGISGDPRHFLKIMEEQCQRLGRMIEEVLEVSRLEQGVAQRHIEWGPVALPGVVRKVAQGLRQEILLKELRLHERVEDGLPPIPGDEGLLQLLVSNLLENAVKFTPRGGGIEVGLHADDGAVVLTVKDDGIGISQEHQERIFDKFFIVSDGASRTHGGAGIGLYLAKEVAAIHDGRIRVESASGRGSLFEVRLPQRPGH
jgi:signal transduction histidine kinase/putative methionine-R-sulfoxide reductase with GAF domain